MSTSDAPNHFVSASCGEPCNAWVGEGADLRHCGKPSTHKLGEEIPWDEPVKAESGPNGFSCIPLERVGHNLTAYVCCEHYWRTVGPAAPCFPNEHRPGLWRRPTP